jgi:nucleoside-diphosphate-sugar epimerase
MHVVVTGAYGFIGSAVVARLLADGHAVIGVGRRPAAARRVPEARWISLDIARDLAMIEKPILPFWDLR